MGDLTPIPVRSRHPTTPVWIERTRYQMGTSLRVRIGARDRQAAIAASEAVFREVARIEDLVSTWRDDTPLARVNQAGPEVVQPVPPELGALLAEVGAWRERVDGVFDPAIGALVTVWDLRGSGRIPSEIELDLARAASGWSKFEFGARWVTRLHPDAWIDAGAFGKGAALRAALSRLETLQVSGALLDFGGQVVAFGDDADGRDGWTVPVAHPSERSTAALAVRLRDRNIATSGSSERFVTVDGVRLGHILDPRDGRPVEAWGSVSVIAEDPLMADILSTALYVLGPEAALEWARVRDDVGVLVLEAHPEGLKRRWNPAFSRWLASSRPVHGAGSPTRTTLETMRK